MKIPNTALHQYSSILSLARIVSEDSQRSGGDSKLSIKSSKDS